MEQVVVIIAIILLVAIAWYLWRENGRAAEGRAAEARQRQAATQAGQAVADETGQRGSGMFQQAADAASGARYERAAERMQDMADELAQTRREADLAAEHLTRQADAALAAMQTAAAAFGGAVPGDGSANCPASYPVKGDQAAMLYSEPGQRIYEATIPHICFRSVAAAEAAGFSPAYPNAGNGGGLVERIDTIAVDAAGGVTEESAAAVVSNDSLSGLQEDHPDVVARAIAAADAGGVPPGAIRGDGGRDCPAAYPIKGNSASLLYHEPGTGTYQATIPEFCFSSREHAEAAGFRASRR